MVISGRAVQKSGVQNRLPQGGLNPDSLTDPLRQLSYPSRDGFLNSKDRLRSGVERWSLFDVVKSHSHTAFGIPIRPSKIPPVFLSFGVWFVDRSVQALADNVGRKVGNYSWKGSTLRLTCRGKMVPKIIFYTAEMLFLKPEPFIR